MEDYERCVNCRVCDAHKYSDGTSRYWCRHNAPTDSCVNEELGRDGPRTQSRWREVDADCWCGQFKLDERFGAIQPFDETKRPTIYNKYATARIKNGDGL